MTVDIKVWSHEDTKRALKEGISGLEASLNKWNSIVNGLSTMYGQAKVRCGLCEKYEGDMANCSKCPLQKLWGINCVDTLSPFKQFMNSIKEASRNAEIMREELGKLDVKEQKIKELEVQLREPKGEPLTVDMNDIFYSREANRFFQIRGTDCYDNYMRSGLTHYFGDARTNNQSDGVSYEYIKEHCIKVTEDILPLHPALWEKDHIGWHVK